MPTTTVKTKHTGVYQRGSTFAFWIKVKGPDGRWRQEWTSGFPTAAKAAAARRDAMTDKGRGDHVARSARTVGDYLAEWLDGQINLKPTTLHGYRVQVRAHIAPGIGRVKLQDLSLTVLNRFYRDLFEHKGLSARSVELCNAVLRKALNDAVRAGELKVNPATHATLPRKSKPQLAEPWTADELQRFVTSVEDHPLQAAFVVAANTGARRGEVAGLRWMDVDLDGARLHIRRPRTTINGKAVEDDPKNTTSARNIGIDKFTVEVLRRHRDELMASGFDRVGPDRCVFQERDGGGIDPNRLSREFKTAAKRAGLREVRFHDLRHTHATVLLKAGVPAEVVAKRLGHATPVVTLTVYRHVLESEDTDAVAVFGQQVYGR